MGKKIKGSPPKRPKPNRPLETLDKLYLHICISVRDHATLRVRFGIMSSRRGYEYSKILAAFSALYAEVSSEERRTFRITRRSTEILLAPW